MVPSLANKADGQTLRFVFLSKKERMEHHHDEGDKVRGAFSSSVIYDGKENKNIVTNFRL